ncbi:phage antirepressor KilAC domain-containing protein [Leifsonia virtsii]|uniref:BRO family protein n=1 Tax=Leifsonia virtsii TaxID=3035915 RepID=A0ABT8J078_9MICO|nr:phage antirepressor KilAC domain-containing protein [Leifsonia virtsii]MDN4598488.1 BRO family protein [Leifsonia virtsii]
MSSTDISIFRREGVDLRVIVIDDEPWFVASDVARALGYREARDLTRNLDNDEKAPHNLRTPGGEQTVSIISEAGLFSGILRSRVPQARAFKRWVTHDVLPSIHRTGAYAVETQRALPHDFASALRELLAEVEAHDETRAQLAEAQPRADAWNAIASAEGDYAVGDAAKILNRSGIPTGPQRLFAQLEEIRWIYRGGDGKWRPFAERVEKGFLAEKPQFHHHPATGELVLDAPQVRVTIKGIEKLRQRLHVGALQAVTAS